MNIIIDKFYHFGKECENNCKPASERFNETLAKHMCNDNTVLRLLFAIDGTDVKTIQDIAINSKDKDPSVQAVLESLSRKFPASAPSFMDEDTAFAFIRSRYLQFGGELDAIVDSLGEIADSAKSELDAAAAAASGPKSDAGK